MIWLARMTNGQAPISAEPGSTFQASRRETRSENGVDIISTWPAASARADRSFQQGRPAVVVGDHRAGVRGQVVDPPVAIDGEPVPRGPRRIGRKRLEDRVLVVLRRQVRIAFLARHLLADLARQELLCGGRVEGLDRLRRAGRERRPRRAPRRHSRSGAASARLQARRIEQADGRIICRASAPASSP